MGTGGRKKTLTLKKLKARVDELCKNEKNLNREVYSDGCDCWGEAEDLVIEGDILLLKRRLG